MKIKMSVVIVSCVFLFAMIFAGCGQQDKPKETAKAPQVETQAAEKVETQTAQPETQAVKEVETQAAEEIKTQTIEEDKTPAAETPAEVQEAPAAKKEQKAGFIYSGPMGDLEWSRPMNSTKEWIAKNQAR